jgi:hypothetical protein
MLDQSANLAVSLAANYPEFPDSCLRVQFTFLIDVLEMLVNCADVLLKQLSEQGLGEPKGLVLKAAFETGPPILGLVEKDFTVRR